MKKPNFAEASDEFSHIAKNLSNDGHHAYSGLCHMAIARLELLLFMLLCCKPWSLQYIKYIIALLDCKSNYMSSN